MDIYNFNHNLEACILSILHPSNEFPQLFPRTDRFAPITTVQFYILPGRGRSTGQVPRNPSHSVPRQGKN